MRVVSCIAGSTLIVCALAGVAEAQNPAPAQQQPAPMSFFITSAGKGEGANLGGLAAPSSQRRRAPTSCRGGSGART